MASRQFNKKVRTIQSDNGNEFLSLRQFFRVNEIQHQTSCIYTPQQNGRVERKHYHLLNMARSLLFQADLSTKFWSESVLTTSCLINQTPTPLLKNKTPYEVLYSKSITSPHLRDLDVYVSRNVILHLGINFKNKVDDVYLLVILTIRKDGVSLKLIKKKFCYK